MPTAVPVFDLIETLRRRYPEMSQGQRRVADVIVRDQDEAQFLTAAQLAHRAGVSESAVVRFAQFLHFPGYPALRRAVSHDFRARATNRRLLFSGRAALATQPELISEIAHRDAGLIEETALRLDPETLQICADAILAADRVFITGHRTSYALAEYFANTLMQAIGVGTPLSFGTGMAFDVIGSAKPDDILIAIAITPYAQQTMNLLQAATRQGLRRIVLTDHPLGAPAHAATDVILFETALHALTSSYVGAMTIIHVILALVSRQSEERVVQFFGRVDAFNEAFATRYQSAPAPIRGDKAVVAAPARDQDRRR